MPPFTPYWVQSRESVPRAPHSWAFFVVAKLDPTPASPHHPLAVVKFQAKGGRTQKYIEGRDLLASILGAVDIFSDSHNRTAILSELALAREFYRNPDSVLPPTVELPSYTDREFFFQDDPVILAQIHAKDEEVKFPFISTCLYLGVTFRRTFYRKRPEPVLAPLGTVYRDNNILFGMVVLDITDLNAVRYGIVGFWVSGMIHMTSPDPGFTMTPKGPNPNGDYAIRAEEDRPREPLSAVQYMTKFGYQKLEFEGYYSKAEPELSELQAHRLVEQNAMDLVWQPSEMTAPISPLSHNARGPDSLSSQAINSLVRATSQIDSFDLSVFDDVRGLPRFHELLRQHLLRRSEPVGRFRSTGQLIGLLFTGQEHLNLGPFKGLSAEDIMTAWKTTSPSPTSISICLDTVSSSPAELIDALAQCSSVRDLYLPQDPGIRSHVRVAESLQELSSRPNLIRGKLIPAEAYSAALRNELWLPATTHALPFSDFPVQHMFVCQHAGYREKAWLNYYPLGDTLLRPERFAAAFLSFLLGLLRYSPVRDDNADLFPLSTAPPSLSEPDRIEIGPIPADALLVPRQHEWKVAGNPQPAPGAAHGGGCFVPLKHEHIPRGCWVALVARTLYLTPEGDQTEHFRYALVRARVDIPTDAQQVKALVDNTQRPDELLEEVVGLQEFLRATAPEVDPAVVDARLADFARAADAVPRRIPLPPGMRRLEVMGRNEAVCMLRDCLAGPGAVDDELYLELMRGPDSAWVHRGYPDSFELYLPPSTYTCY